MLRKVRVLFVVTAVAVAFSACSLPGVVIFGDSDPGIVLGAGENATVHFFTNEANFDTGINLQTGNRYGLDITILSYWIDNYIDRNENDEPLDERGFADSRMMREFEDTVIPFVLAQLTKRSYNHRWFELMMYQPNCKRDSLQGITDLSTDADSGSYNFVAACDGKLTLFVNDSHGFYSNNVGYTNISLSRVN